MLPGIHGVGEGVLERIPGRYGKTTVFLVLDMIGKQAKRSIAQKLNLCSSRLTKFSVNILSMNFKCRRGPRTFQIKSLLSSFFRSTSAPGEKEHVGLRGPPARR